MSDNKWSFLQLLRIIDFHGVDLEIGSEVTKREI